MRSICYICSCDSLDKLKQKLPSLEREIADGAKFKDFYQFTFNYAKNSGQKSLDLEMALAYWDIVLKDRFRFLGHWCKFLKVNTYLTHGRHLYIVYLSSYISIWTPQLAHFQASGVRGRAYKQ